MVRSALIPLAAAVLFAASATAPAQGQGVPGFGIPGESIPGFSIPQEDEPDGDVPALPGVPEVPGVPGFPGKGDRIDRPRVETQSADERRQSRLDRMFNQLAKAETKARADRIAGHIMRRMTRSGSDTVDLLMNRSAVAMRAKDYGLALDLLDGVVRLKPDFAEGWNRRATVNFLAGNYGRSVADIEETLKLEPRHWGALVGLSVILVSMDQKEEAVRIMSDALKIHPHLEDTRDRLRRLELEVGGIDA